MTDVEAIIAALDRGEIRVAEKADGEWRVNEEAKQAILDYFRLRDMEPLEAGPFEYLDKIPLKRDYERLGVRVVPPATARYGSFLSPGVVMMPSYVNIGAWVGPRTMVDTWATVGTAPQEFVQRASIVAWDDEEHVARARDTYRRKRELLLGALERRGYRVVGSRAGMYLWVEARADVVPRLLEHGVVVSPGEFFGPSGAGYVRLALVPTVEECERAARILEEAL